MQDASFNLQAPDIRYSIRSYQEFANRREFFKSHKELQTKIENYKFRLTFEPDNPENQRELDAAIALYASTSVFHDILAAVYLMPIYERLSKKLEEIQGRVRLGEGTIEDIQQLPTRRGRVQEVKKQLEKYSGVESGVAKIAHFFRSLFGSNFHRARKL